MFICSITHSEYMKIFCSFLMFLLAFHAVNGQASQKLLNKVNQSAVRLESKTIEWRRDIHQHPELSNREFKTAEKVAGHLRSLGITVQTEVAHTGVVGILDSGRPGPVIALRADMDALPVTENNDLPFASQVKTTFNGQETGVMHACGHDAHTAVLMSVAEILAEHKAELKGIVKFIFQPAEEGAPAGEEGGAALMVKEGVLTNPKVDVIFGLHVRSFQPLGTIYYKAAGMMAASDWFTIKVKGKQSHGAAPWLGVDPVVVSAQVINGLQAIVSRQTELTKEAAVITVGMIHGGIRQNIIPAEVEMSGTIRTLDTVMQKDIHEKIVRTATKIAESAGATAEVTFDGKTPVVYNEPALVEKLVPTLRQVVGEKHVVLMNADTGAEDFAFYQQKVPGFFFFVGACPPDVPKEKAPAHHTPDFKMDEKSMVTGVKAMLGITLSYMFSSR